MLGIGVEFIVTTTVSGSEGETAINSAALISAPGFFGANPNHNSASDEDPMGLFNDGFKALVEE
ncbi:MAG: hypothetical protein AAF446_11660 [Pseudomonadota bacterium]